MQQPTGSDISDVKEIGFVQRIVVGNGNHTDRSPADDEDAQALALLNRCLADNPRGHIIAVER